MRTEEQTRPPHCPFIYGRCTKSQYKSQKLNFNILLPVHQLSSVNVRLTKQKGKMK